ncbi:hypothetical protein ACUSIJ_23570 [Pseudochelatococcus sp. B33]
MAAVGQDRPLADRWQPVFRHSAGRLGSIYLTKIREEGRLVGWKTFNPGRVSVPPKDFGSEGEWVDVGPGAELLSFAPPDWVADSGEALLEGFVLARVRLDGAEAPIFAPLRLSGADATLRRGMPLEVRFRESGEADGPDFWFQSNEGEGAAR